jgi:hypothetical protein
MRVKSATILWLLAASVSVAAQQPKRSPDPVLVSFRIQLERELHDLRPAASFEMLADSAGEHLVMRYKTKEYLVYPTLGAGRPNVALQRRDGPLDEGVLLSIHLQPKGQLNALKVPQTFEEPYWSTFVNVYPIAGTDKQIFLRLSFRDAARTDLIIKKIKRIAETSERRSPSQANRLAR